LVGAIAARLHSDGDFRSALHDTLRDIGQMIRAHRVLVGRSAWDSTAIVSEIFQWQTDGLAPWSLDDVQQRVWKSPWTYEMIRSRRRVIIADLEEVPATAVSDLAHLRATNVHWVAFLPLCVGSELLGVLLCIRYADPPREDLTTEQLRIIDVVQGLLASLVFQASVRSDLERRVAAERERLARELHDNVTQSVYSLALFASSARMAMEDGNATKLLGDIEEIRLTAIRTLRELRVLLHDLRPSVLEGRGLASAIEERFDSVERRLGIRATLRAAEDLALEAPLEDVLYQVAMEALSNVVKHAEARAVEVSLDRVDGEIRLQVADDGRGFHPPSAVPGMGLAILRERVEQVAGHVTVDSEPGHGTRIRVRVPAAAV
jgi:signal transduction histidine kinase